LRGTQFDYDYKGNILFIEDIGEHPYCIDRMMQNLRLSGILSQISGLIAGQFSDADEDPLMNGTVYENIRKIVSDYGVPVCFDFPAGHVDNNLPVIIGSEARLYITEEKTVLNYI
ncbi:LD-carboxypeptidase, partial [Paludibacteraceae bacterium OttesenSCG-928-F17]|nr:LD-carboxypeptidase [Paludibacteraceae bacterium OttesenSCG-928-F17]